MRTWHLSFLDFVHEAKIWEYKLLQPNKAFVPNFRVMDVFWKMRMLKPKNSNFSLFFRKWSKNEVFQNIYFLDFVHEAKIRNKSFVKLQQIVFHDILFSNELFFPSLTYIIYNEKFNSAFTYCIPIEKPLRLC